MPRGGLWRNPDFLRLWTGQAISQMGSAVSAQALPLAAVLSLGASPLQMGLLNGAGAAAILLFGLFAGAWVDRFRRRPILIFADLGRAAVFGAIPLAAAFHRLSMNYLYLAAASGGLLSVFFDSGYQAYVPALVRRENILEANAKLALTVSIADITGTGAAGVLVQWLTAPMAILSDAASFLCSAFSVWRIQTREPPPKIDGPRHMQREIAEGLREAWHNPTLRILTRRTATAAFFLGFIGCLYFVFAIRELHLSPALLGGIIAIGGVSNLFGALISERLVARFGIARTLLGSALAAGAAALLLPLAHGPVPACAATLALAQTLDMAWPIYHINELTLRQTVTPDRLLGRVNSAMHLLFRGIMPAGALAGGILAESIGMRPTLLAGALGFLLSSLWLVKLTRIHPTKPA
ncbi:MAG: MFS transporter [Candidatus Sulfopaludibacter sp.]|nr:MFS transporter [Candidatus Sulfopaludibacter sp.]